MNYTTNYHLPQWSESDRILMGDFNDAMSRIETGLSEVVRMECVTVDTRGKVSGDIIYTFAAAPRFIFIRSEYDGAILPAGGTAKIIDYLDYGRDYIVTYQLSGTALIMAERIETTAARDLTSVAVY